MSEEKAIEIIKTLANSQGFYGRLYREIMHNGLDINKLVNLNNCNDALDLILELEG